MPFGLFDGFGFFSFGGDVSPAEAIYDAYVDAVKDAFDCTPGTYEEARAYARAFLYGEALVTLRRGRAQLQPSTVSDKLEDMEADYRIVPNPSDSQDTRRARLVARKMLMAGGRMEALWTALNADLGGDFIALRPTRSSEVQTFPADPSIVGTFPKFSSVPRFYKLLDPVACLDVAIPVRISPINGSAAPFAGEKLTIEPEVVGNAEAVTLASVTPYVVGGVTAGWTITTTAPFTKAHSTGAAALTATPLWLSNQREMRVVMSDAATRNAQKRRRVHVIMQRHSKAVTRWRLVAATSSSSIGPFIIGQGFNRVGATALGASAGSF